MGINIRNKPIKTLELTPENTEALCDYLCTERYEVMITHDHIDAKRLTTRGYVLFSFVSGLSKMTIHDFDGKLMHEYFSLGDTPETMLQRANKWVSLGFFDVWLDDAVPKAPTSGLYVKWGDRAFHVKSVGPLTTSILLPGYKSTHLDVSSKEIEFFADTLTIRKPTEDNTIMPAYITLIDKKTNVKYGPYSDKKLTEVDDLIARHFGEEPSAINWYHNWVNAIACYVAANWTVKDIEDELQKQSRAFPEWKGQEIWEFLKDNYTITNNWGADSHWTLKKQGT